MFKTLLASGSDPTWDLPAMHNVPSAHSFPFVKQDRSTCRRYMRTVHWQNGEQVSRTVLTFCFQLVSRGPPGSWHAAVSARAIHRRLQRMPSNGGEFSGWLDRSAHIARGSAASVKMCKNVRKKPRMRTYTTYDDGRIL